MLQDELVTQLEYLKACLITVDEGTILGRSIYHFSESNWNRVEKEINWLEEKIEEVVKYINELEKQIDITFWK